MKKTPRVAAKETNATRGTTSTGMPGVRWAYSPLTLHEREHLAEATADIVGLGRDVAADLHADRRGTEAAKARSECTSEHVGK